MLTIKFDDATIKRAIGAFCGKMAGSGFDRLADVFAAEAHRQLAEHVAKCSAMTDEDLAQELRKAWYHSGKEGWLEFGRRAREILAFAQPQECGNILSVYKDGTYTIGSKLDAEYAANDPAWLCNIDVRELEYPSKPAAQEKPVFEAGKSYRNKRGMGVPLKSINSPDAFYQFIGGGLKYSADGRIYRDRDSEFDLIPGAIDDDPDIEALAEKADAEAAGYKKRLEAMRAEAEDEMRTLPADQSYGGGVRQGLLMAVCAAGFRVIPEVPAQPLRVEACDE